MVRKDGDGDGDKERKGEDGDGDGDKEREGEGEAVYQEGGSRETPTGDSGAASTAPMPPSRTAPAQMPHPRPTASVLQALRDTQQPPILDPNLMMMAKAETIAAMVARAAQKIRHESNFSLPSTSPGAPASSIAPSSTSGGLKSVVPSPVAALLAATGGANPALQLQGSAPFIPGHLRQVIPNSAVLSTGTPAISGTQSWAFGQREKHVGLLLLADAQRKEKRKAARRAANRKSQTIARARTKAYVEEMARTNVRLKRQAHILALLPDFVIAITLEGEITFCSNQAQKELGYEPSDLVGTSLYKVLAPASRNALKKLIQKLASPGKPGPSRQPQASWHRRGTKRRHFDQKDAGEAAEARSNEVSGKVDISIPGGGSSRASVGKVAETPGAAVVNTLSEHSFPPSIVNLKRKRPSASPEDNGEASLSSDTKNTGNTNADLDCDVRRHNQRVMEGSEKAESGDGHQAEVSSKREETKRGRYEHDGDRSSSDDSLLEGIEENNEVGNASGDYGYGEGNHLGEEPSSLGSDSSNSNVRRKSFPPALGLRLIRADSTTVWCEVTFRLQPANPEEDRPEEQTVESDGSVDSNIIVKEVLLSLRPIDDGRMGFHPATVRNKELDT